MIKHELNKFFCGSIGALLAINVDILNSEVGKIVSAGVMTIATQLVINWINRKRNANK